MTIIAHAQEFAVQALDISTHSHLVADLADASRDFSELVEGEYHGSQAAIEEIFTEVPPGYPLTDKIIWGVFENSDRLAGVVEMLRNYKNEGCLWISLLLLRPEWRGGGLGSAVTAAIFDWAAANGCTEVGLGVVDCNPRALRFWSRQGFVEVRRHEAVRMGSKVNTIIAMKKVIA